MYSGGLRYAAPLAAAYYGARRILKARRRIPARVRTRIGIRRSRTRTITRRRPKLRLRTRKRIRRNRARFRMTPSSCRLVRFKHVNEWQHTWELSSGSTFCGPIRIQDMHSRWMAPPDTNELQEAIFNSYNHKKLRNMSWKMDNIRIWVETRTTVATIGTAPPVTDIQVVEAPAWVMWVWRQLASGDTVPPAASDESRYERHLISNPRSKIWGKVPINQLRTSWINNTYSSAFDTTSGAYNNMDTFLNAISNTPTGLPSGVDKQCSPDIHIMPDDPYPTSIYSESGVTRTVKLHVIADITTFTTWKLRGVRAS